MSRPLLAPLYLATLALAGCASSVAPLDGGHVPVGTVDVVDATPASCASGTPSSVHLTAGATAFAQCPSAMAASPDAAHAPRIHGFHVSSPCGCGAGLAVDVDVTDSDTPASELRVCMLIMACSSPDWQGSASGTSFWSQCNHTNVGSWTLAVVDPQGNHDDVAGWQASADAVFGCADRTLDCDGMLSSGIGGGQRGCE